VDDFEAFVRARSAALARTAYLLTGDLHLAEDLLQETLTRVAQRWTRIARADDPEPYVRRTLYTCAVDGWRRRSRQVPEARVPVEDRPELRGPDDSADVVASRLVLRDALSRLTVRQRAVLVLRFYEDCTEVETADMLGCSTSTVKSQTRHALERLRVLAPELAETFDRTSTVEAR